MPSRLLYFEKPSEGACKVPELVEIFSKQTLV